MRKRDRQVQITPVEGPDGRLYFNLRDVAASLRTHPKANRFPPSELNYWAEALEAIDEQFTKLGEQAGAFRSTRESSQS